MKVIGFLLVFLIGGCVIYAQQGKPQAVKPYLRSLAGADNNLFGTRTSFIENIGQYGDTLKGYGYMGKILYGYEGFAIPVLFTERGIIYLQRVIPKREKEERAQREENPDFHIDRVLTMIWMGANENKKIISEDIKQGYHTYGLLSGKARGFKKIIYKDIYRGIDIEYSFTNNKMGFEYKIIVGAGVDVSKLKMHYQGDIQSIKKDRDGNLIINSEIDGITESAPETFSNNEKKIVTKYEINGNEVTLALPPGYENVNGLVIDPFISPVNNFVPNNLMNVDYDYNGNVYLSAQSFFTKSQLAKYDANGVWQWTFSGSLSSPTMSYYNNCWAVEKTSGNTYLSCRNGIVDDLPQLIRLNSNGIYDNFITDQNPNITEYWKMIWDCNNGSQMLVIGGGFTPFSGISIPPSVNLSSFNITGLSADGQDVADMVLDPITKELYTIFALTPSASFHNRIYKNKFPYSASNLIWDKPSGFATLNEAKNRPYVTTNFSENSANLFAVNSTYLFYWDGLNLKAFDKASGNVTGTPLVLTLQQPALWQGGIVADDCNNVFIGYEQGLIKVFKFDGSTFNDAAVPDILIPDFGIPWYPDVRTHDLKYDYARQLLYACGEGYVASFDVSSYCGRSVIVQTNCNNSSAQAAINPFPQSGTSITYFLYDGASLITSNTTGLFTGLAQGILYTVKSYIDRQCQSIETVGSFIMPVSPSISVISTNAICSNNNGSITANATGGNPPLQYSINGTTYQSSNIFSGLPANNYTVYVKDANNCITTTPAIIDDESAPSLSANTSTASCANNDGSITATPTGGKPPLQYSINGTTFQSSNIFTALASGSYTVTVKDANDCTVAYPVTVSSTTIPPVSGISIYPNPTGNNQFNIVLGNQLQGSYSIRILDMTGQLVYKTVISNTCTCCTGSYSIKLPFVLSSGVYNVEVIDPVNNKNVQRLIVTAIK